MTIEALKLALEALGWTDEWRPQGLKERALTALRTAIERTEKQEPVAQIIALGQYEFPGLEWLSADHSFRAPIGTLLYTTPPAAQQEPDAYGYAKRLAEAIWQKHYKATAPQWKPFDDLIGVLTQIDNMTAGLTAQRKPLTDKEIIALRTSIDPIKFARAIEAAHGIKGKNHG